MYTAHEHEPHTGSPTFSIFFRSPGSTPAVSVSSFRTCSMGSRCVRMEEISSRVRYVDPGSLMECPWYLYVSISSTIGPFATACFFAYATPCRERPVRVPGRNQAHALRWRPSASLPSPLLTLAESWAQSMKTSFGMLLLSHHMSAWRLTCLTARTSMPSIFRPGM